VDFLRCSSGLAANGVDLRLQDGDRLTYAARKRDGFTPASRDALFRRFKALEIAACPFANLPEAKSGWIRWVAKDDPVAHGQVSIPRPKRCAGASSLLRTPRLFELTKKSMNGSLPTISRRPDSLYSIKLVTAITRL